MVENLPNLSRTEFTRLVRDALNRLYDSGYLENHPLSSMLLPLTNQANLASQELRRILLTTIQSMHPGKSAPKESRDWRGYRILELRYITGLTAAEVMQRLALGRSLFFLEQARALEVLVDRLWLQAQSYSQTSTTLHKTGNTGQPGPEFDRLLQVTEWERIELGELLEKLQPVLTALVISQGGELEDSFQPPAYLEHANRVLLRQVIVSLVSHGLEIVPAGRVSITNHECAGPGLLVRVRPPGKPHPEAGPGSGQGLSLELCRQYLQAMEGSLQVEELPDGIWEAGLSWPGSQPRRLLVIDDNPDFIDLVRRYLDGSDWQVSGAGDGESARQVMECAPPHLILLDVILPKEDGWELLLALKTSETTPIIPVIVCSAIHEPDLVAALGGAGFLPKPLTRLALLKALEMAAPGDSILASEPPESSGPLE